MLFVSGVFAAPPMEGWWRRQQLQYRGGGEDLKAAQLSIEGGMAVVVVSVSDFLIDWLIVLSGNLILDDALHWWQAFRSCLAFLAFSPIEKVLLML
jgi:hypothetical protein